MLLSIGMMVKNEEKYLEKCLKSLMPLIDSLDAELIVVDTGSEDRTVEIAKKYASKVYFEKWNNNFSEMRNLTIQYCSGEWFLCIDGDEILEDTTGIIEFFKSGEYNKYNSCSMNIKNYVTNLDRSKYSICDTIRLFRNDGIFKYKGTVHNQPIYKEPTKKIKCLIEHFGYISDDKELMEKKFKRTSNILKAELEKNPDDIYYRYQLAVSYSMHGDNKEALEEISKVYRKLNSENKKQYKYVLNEYANILMLNLKLKECESFCEKELKFTSIDEMYKIDLFYYLAKSQSLQYNYQNSIINYKKFIRILDKFENGELPVDLSIKVMNSSKREEVYSDLAIVEYHMENYTEVIKNIGFIKDEKKVKNLINIFISSYIKLRDYSGLLKEYKIKILKYSDETIRNFQGELENIKNDLKNDEIINQIDSLFTHVSDDTSYGMLNSLRITIDMSEKEKIYEDIVNKTDFNRELSFYGEILYIALKNNFDISLIIDKLEYKKIFEFLYYCNEKYKKFSNDLLNFINKYNNDDLLSYRINTSFTKVLLLVNEINKNDYKRIFNIYIQNGIKLIKNIYSKNVLDNELILEVRNNEHKFFLYMFKAEMIKGVDEHICIKYLEKALKVFPHMNIGIKSILKDLEKEISYNDTEMDKLKEELIRNINILISSGNMSESIKCLHEYEKVIGKNWDSLYLKSIILNSKNSRDNF